MIIFEIEEAQERMDELLDLAEAGEDVIVTRAGAPLVRLEPIQADE